MIHPLLPTQEQFAEWDSEYFDGERQNFDVMMIKAFQAGADQQLERDIEWLNATISVNLPCLDIDSLPEELQKAMRPLEES